MKIALPSNFGKMDYLERRYILDEIQRIEWRYEELERSRKLEKRRDRIEIKSRFTNLISKRKRRVVVYEKGVPTLHGKKCLLKPTRIFGSVIIKGIPEEYCERKEGILLKAYEVLEDICTSLDADCYAMSESYLTGYDRDEHIIKFHPKYIFAVQFFNKIK